MATNGRWGKWTELLSGLPYDVQSRLYYVLSNYGGVDPATCYRLPYLASTQRQNIGVGAQANDAFRFQTLTAIYGISATIENEQFTNVGLTAGVSGLSPVYGSEVAVQINFNNGATTFLGTAQEPAFLSCFGSPDSITRCDPVTAVKNDQWTVQWNGAAGLANAVFSVINLHGVKIYQAAGAI